MVAFQPLIIASTRITTRVNNTAVATEIIGIAGLTVLLLIVAAVRSLGHWSNLTSTGAVPQAGYYAWLGPFMLATLLGADTIVGFEAASNLAEETHEPHKVIPRAMRRAVLVSGVAGFAFLVVLAYATNKAAYASAAPVASIVHDVLGGVITLVLRTHTAALATLFTASTIMPALLYAGTVLLYVFTSRRPGTQQAGGGTGARSADLNFRSLPGR
jgi:amino acid transporter